MRQPHAAHPPVGASAGVPLVRVEHLTRVIATRAQKTIILDDVTFNVPTHSLFAINGPSGSGKSTLLNLLTGIDRPTSGRVVFAGQPLSARSENALARWRGGHVGIIFQFFQLVPTLTAMENVLLALELGKGGGLPRRAWRGARRRVWIWWAWALLGAVCPVSFRAGSSSASRLRARWRMIRLCWWPMSRPVTWTPTRRTASSIRWQA